MEKYIAPATSLPLSDNTIQNSLIIKADLLPDPESQLDSMEMKEKPIADSSIPFRDLTNSTTKKESIARLINKLNVKNNIRYQRTVEDTYCNVYSYDYCYFNKVYLPTVWWTPEALKKILEGQEVEAIFEETVDRIYSSAIHDWFLEWGASFGWKRMFTVDDIQNEVNNNGGIGIICAKRKQKGLSGHIVPVVPETDVNKAYRENGIVVYPLQSQAGKLNYNYFAKARKDWWNNELYSSHVFYYHE
ncbi:hypothetical protein [Flavobacterium hibernum]|uniref:Uncharacterized protein n=1 Tax=Flavobacterium hibernum TaxID=37752 RepID=A0A0D0F183_9FLAO|nr:hypothetical protein [Flavobacterium hibernum]KIO51752.1 hypothetical protein IW18_15920 [Flavobacterium hibernum]OXA91785.1 hypothetical protein B0A73_00695 [Flavobacterium hibernum]STO09716.1 Uncharacterised protein [Flavobacterium hibernum]